MNIQELLNKNDRFAANAGCRITEADDCHAIPRVGLIMDVTDNFCNIRRSL